MGSVGRVVEVALANGRVNEFVGHAARGANKGVAMMKSRRFASVSKPARKVSSLSALFLLATTVSVSGCCLSTSPPSEAELQGNWLVVTEQVLETLNRLLLTIDASGNIAKVTFQVTSNGAERTDNNPTGTTNVNGEDVTLQISFSGNNLAFAGTFQPNNHNVLEGLISVSLNAAEGSVSLANEPAQLIRQ